MQGGRAALKRELKRLEWETRRNEVIHLLAMVLIGSLLISKFTQLSLAQIFGIFAINLYVNAYPIFLQRYNRFRLMRIMSR